MEEKLNWIFTAFDADGGGSIDVEEINEVVLWMFREQDLALMVMITVILNNGEMIPQQVIHVFWSSLRFAGIEQDPDLVASCVIDVRATIDVDNDGDITQEEFIKNALDSQFIAEVLKERKKKEYNL